MMTISCQTDEDKIEFIRSPTVNLLLLFNNIVSVLRNEKEDVIDAFVPLLEPRSRSAI